MRKGGACLPPHAAGRLYGHRWRGVRRSAPSATNSGAVACRRRSCRQGHARSPDRTPQPHAASTAAGAGLQRARRMSGAVALLYVDLDWFKEINDEFGHTQPATLCSAEVALRLRAAVPPRNHRRRLGGDEFVVLCDPIVEAPTRHEIAEAGACGAVAVGVGRRPRDGPERQRGRGPLVGARTPDRAVLHAADTSLYRPSGPGKAGRIGARHKRGRNSPASVSARCERSGRCCGAVAESGASVARRATETAARSLCLLALSPAAGRPIPK